MSDVEIRPDVRAFLDVLNGTPAAHLEALTPVQARDLMTKIRTARSAEPPSLAMLGDFEIPGPAGKIRLRLYDAQHQRGPGPMIVYYHGGGFVLGDLDSHNLLCAEIAQVTNLPLVSVDYRLAPEHRFPAAPEDAEAAARWVASNSCAAFGREATSLVLAGDSAGANLAAVTARALRDVPASVSVALQFLIYPTTGPAAYTESRRQFARGFFLTDASIAWFEELYAGTADDKRYDLGSFDLSGMPVTLLVTAELDPLRDEGRAYAARLIEAGVQVTFQEASGNIHGCFGLKAAVPSSATDVKRALDALRLMVAAA